ncbi:unnamed protein product [Colletotrichum noveboracense]|uniref:Uncharacterized protein n=1 Tax=Colletotrichum noveboracense TaxID=2664923 RepID=A0A9W4WAS9_9PEZI|nr:hypothetical protein COL940_002616 [Colletotrichum noveboracense]KAJ0293571.1 hypothetical protein CBS470a_001778 [Colletotrichum nupharicola]KAJ0304617.1 hypothetical protein Brms1b_011204 [Colletotrichum noveboracense]CAI0642345.1 unnamed protein product [Colletotrichum noveboracense]
MVSAISLTRLLSGLALLPAVAFSTPLTLSNLKRQDDPIPNRFVTDTTDAFSSGDYGDITLTNSTCELITIEGPFGSIQSYQTGFEGARVMNLTSAGGNRTLLHNSGTDTSDHWRAFRGKDAVVFGNNERVTEFAFQDRGEGLYAGFKIVTDTGRTQYDTNYAASDPSMYPPWLNVPVGSGILARIRVYYCENGMVGRLGVDFINDIESVSISKIEFNGFTNNIMPAGKGETISVGSQILDARNSSTEQWTTLMTTDAVTKSHSINVGKTWYVGGKVGLEAEAGIPFIGKSTVSTEFNWQVGGTSNEEDLESETITKSSTVHLKCPGGKYCVGTSFYTNFKMNVDVVATFRAKTKAGAEYFWKQKGSYNGADSLALQLTVDETEEPPAPVRRSAVARKS